MLKLLSELLASFTSIIFILALKECFSEVVCMNSAQIAKNMEKRIITMEKLCKQMGIRYLGGKEELF